MAKQRLKPTEASILRVLIKDGGFMNTTEVAKAAGVSWNSAFAYLSKFHQKGWVDKYQYSPTQVQWRAIVN